MSSFVVQTEAFSGPLDVLLSLIERRKLLINDISLARVTDDYLSYISEYDVNPDDVSAFIVIASTLLLIKSKSLLPTLQLSAEEELDSRELQVRLKRYQYVRHVADITHHIWLSSRRIRGKREQKQYDDTVSFSPGQTLTIQTISLAAENLQNNLPLKKDLPQVKVRTKIKLSDAIERLEKRLRDAVSLSFASIQNSREKADRIIYFLGLLELVKRGTIEAEQDASFGDIHINNRTVATPRYG